MPISHGIYGILYDNLNPLEALKQLMARELKHELDYD
jgi:glycerol-3-phosphate dehydrogenase